MNRRAFFKRLGAAAGVVVAAPVIANMMPAHVTSSRPLMLKDMRVFLDANCDRNQIYIVASAPVARAYNDLVRSDEPFWKAQR